MGNVMNMMRFANDLRSIKGRLQRHQKWVGNLQHKLRDPSRGPGGKRDIFRVLKDLGLVGHKMRDHTNRFAQNTRNWMRIVSPRRRTGSPILQELLRAYPPP
jgi:hypothetical protein